MRLLFDTDVLCKLALGQVLSDTADLFGARLSECGRLPALPHMLRRGSLRRHYGADACDDLLQAVTAIPSVSQPSVSWLDRLTQIQAIDPGEALIFAAAAEAGMFVASGDKRALRALKDTKGFPDALAGKIVVVEAILIALCDRLGPQEMRERLERLTRWDTVVRVCFSAGISDPVLGLSSYYGDLAEELRPLVLWDPFRGGDA